MIREFIFVSLGRFFGTISRFCFRNAGERYHKRVVAELQASCETFTARFSRNSGRQI